jgi:uncharacterized protein YkwD
MIERMQATSALVVLALAACGQMYQQPGPPSPAPEPVFAASVEPAPAGSVPLAASAAGSLHPAAPGQTGMLPTTETPAPTLGEQVAADSGGGSHDAVADRFLAAHADARAKHCAAALTWSDTLAAFAQRWADHLASGGCSFGHSSGQYGENLAR